VSEEGKSSFNLIPLMYAGRGDDDDIQNVLKKYKKGQVISVKGFVSQKAVDVEKEDGGQAHQYKNTYFVTSFLSGDMQADFDAIDE
jgi:hypothetical protein